jgi:hypothetical protein
MPNRILDGNEIKYTIIPYHEEAGQPSLSSLLLENPDDSVLGYVTLNPTSTEYQFTYVEGQHEVHAQSHWSLSILEQWTYDNETGPWIIYNVAPGEIGSSYPTAIGYSLHVNNWDAWRVEGKTSLIAYVTDFEIY